MQEEGTAVERQCYEYSMAARRPQCGVAAHLWSKSSRAGVHLICHAWVR